MKTHIKKISLLICICLVFSSLNATVIKGGEKVVITERVEGNVYAAGGKVTINALINGDLIAAGGEITVKDSILKDVLLMGGNLRLQGVTGEDMRIGGGDIVIEKNIGGDLVVGGGNVVIDESVIIFGDLIIGGGSVEMNGRVKGDLRVGAGELDFKGVAEGAVIAKGGKLLINGDVGGQSELSAREIILGENARFHNDVHYWHEAGVIDFSDKLKSNAEATFDPSLKSEASRSMWGDFTKGLYLFYVWQLFACGLLVAIIIWLFPNFFSSAVDNYYQKYINKFGWGMLYLLAIPLAIAILFITVIGIPIGLFLMFVYAFSLAFAHVLVAVVATFELERYRGGQWSKGQQILTGIGLYVLLKILTMIPYLGFLISLLVVSIALGAILMWIVKKKQPATLMV